MDEAAKLWGDLLDERKRVAELEAACRVGLEAVSRLRTAIDSGEGLEQAMVETAENQRRLEVALGI